MMAGFDLHGVCTRCRDKKKGKDPCVERPGTSTTDRQAGGNTGRLFLTFGGLVCADRLSYCPLDRMYKRNKISYFYVIYIVLKNNRKINPQHTNPCSCLFSE